MNSPVTLPDRSVQTAPAPLLPSLHVEAFAADPATRDTVRGAARRPAFGRMTWRVHAGGLDTACEAFATRRSPDLLIVEVPEDKAQLLAKLERLSGVCGPETRLLLLADRGDVPVEVYRDVMKLGVSDLLVPPVGIGDLVTAVVEIYRDLSDLRLGEITAFIGARGSGSSTMAQNAAAAMARTMATDVLLVDLDPQFGTVALNFDINASYSLSDTIKRGTPLDDTLIERIAVPAGERLSLLTVGAAVTNRDELPLDVLRAIIAFPNLHRRHVVLDMPPIWSRRARAVLARVDNLVVTVEPTLQGFRTAADLTQAARAARPDLDDPVMVLNKVARKGGIDVPTRKFRDHLQLGEVHEMPYEPRLAAKAQAHGKPVFAYDETANLSKRIRGMAKTVNRTLDRGDDRPATARIAARLGKWW
jgi:pilus assembly protein CpaE